MRKRRAQEKEREQKSKRDAKSRAWENVSYCFPFLEDSACSCTRLIKVVASRIGSAVTAWNKRQYRRVCFRRRSEKGSKKKAAVERWEKKKREGDPPKVHMWSSNGRGKHSISVCVCVACSPRKQRIRKIVDKGERERKGRKLRLVGILWRACTRHVPRCEKRWSVWDSRNGAFFFSSFRMRSSCCLTLEPTEHFLMCVGGCCVGRTLPRMQAWNFFLFPPVSVKTARYSPPLLRPCSFRRFYKSVSYGKAARRKEKKEERFFCLL